MFVKSLTRLTYSVTLLSILIHVIDGNPLSSQTKGLTLRILHTNDMHARFEETTRLSTPICPKADSIQGKCYGGFARLATLIREARNSSMPVLFLNAGDTYQGSVWYNLFKWEIVADFMNILAPDAISLGNHEFDDGIAGLVPFIHNVTFPVLTTNMDLTYEPELKATKLANSTILDVYGVKIGVIGYLTPETKILSSTRNVIFKNEIPCIREEAKKLKNQGVNILIALGHSGFEMDKKIAKEVEDIDIVIGGHTNTFLYRGKAPDTEVPEGFYPYEVVQKSGKKVYVVQSYAYTKYLGNFTVTFNAKGDVTHIEGNPILVNGKIEQAKDVLKRLDDLRPIVENKTSTEVGETRVLLDGDSKTCRRRECNFGNLITDALIDYNVNEFNTEGAWTDAAIAVHHSGSIRSSISRKKKDKIILGDVLGALPFGNFIIKVNMTGKEILSMLEWSVYHLHSNTSTDLRGAFLQCSGLQITYDLEKPSNSKVVSVEVQCATCRVPSYSKLNVSTNYTVIMNDYIHAGGDGYMLSHLNFTRMSITIEEAVVRYIKKHSPVYPGTEWRINYLQSVETQDTSTAITYHPIMFMIVLPIISRLFT